MPPWFWPVLGALLLLVAYVIFSPNNNIVLATQAYIAAFHVGAVLYHRKLGHHPVAGFPASVFVLIAVLVVTIRGNVIVALLGTVACALIAVVLAEILVHPKVEDGQDSLLEDNREEDASPEARGACEAVLGHGEWCNKLVPSALSDVYNGYHESWLPTNVVRYCVGFIL